MRSLHGMCGVSGKDSGLTKQIYGANVCDGNGGKGNPTKSYADHIGGKFKKGPNCKHPKPTGLHEKIDGCHAGRGRRRRSSPTRHPGGQLNVLSETHGLPFNLTF
ncbi:hypothetical protein EVAR_100154_1 [Eumeta japonica]|uniref:Uncharacterized protein n=1 Tax=Eumeta variegata TaxID=151549 RepID=A0A4C1ZVX3_EUMVA|nr:hypothetical protein EVAR_100154_1 [Eumeta japonica]